ncbi:DNA mismatch repair endonuclease MutL [Puniceicoccaceae bacterium K14]|nr:DNA mismatch repair endonuclease MutL [Puniceicoccaceae bacterium K14]
MGRIEVLSDQVANQIAAGEVIERPASVVKELVENCIDAGATQIEVEFKSGGKNYLRIEDNGCGMSREDALLSLQRHATSKIRSADDLDHVLTMGFRGEALPSIASVSKFLLQTKEKGSESGTEILIDGGERSHVRDCGMPTGTRITISNLFNTVPARRKFLKTVATEGAHIVQHTRLYALAHPEVAFTLIDDGRIVFKTPACNKLKDRIGEIFGKQASKNLLDLEGKEGDLSISGLIGKPGYSKSSRHEMFMFVNNRPVDSKTLAYALIESYHGHIPKGRYPFAFVFLNIPPAKLDVNVHPAKREIRFRNETQVRGLAVKAILDTLRKSLADQQKRISIDVASVPGEKPTPSKIKNLEPVASVVSVKKKEGTTEEAVESKTIARKRIAVVPAAVATIPGKKLSSKPSKSLPEVSSDKAKLETDRKSGEPEKSKTEFQAVNWRHIGWAHSEYALFETKAGLVVLSVNAAQRRVMYEKLCKQFSDKSPETQKLLLPVSMEFDPISSSILGDNLQFLKDHGFDVEPFGRNFYRVESSPVWLPENDLEDFVRELVGLMRQGKLSSSKLEMADRVIAEHAVLRSVQMESNLPSIALTRLLEDLFACSNPLADIDGCPTFFELSKGEIKKRFHKSKGGNTQSFF